MLPEILANKQQELASVDRVTAIDRMKEQVKPGPAKHSLARALKQAVTIALIAEIKRKSPSKGMLAEGIDPAAVAGEYMNAGASAVSVLTDRKYFAGSLEDLQAVRTSIDLPIVRKDFIIDDYQVYESRVAGADVILLIAAALDPSTLERLYHLAYDIGLEVLVEVHSEDELMNVLPFHPKIIGVNNRNLQTFQTDLTVAERLRERIPGGTICVAESGIHTREDMQRMEQAGFDAALIGEGIITAPDRIVRIKELLGGHAHAS